MKLKIYRIVRWIVVLLLILANGWLFYIFVTDRSDIDFWYGKTQSFGELGTPQRYINIHGTVRDRTGLASLVYSLNRGRPVDLSIGPDTRRLYHQGDFNIDIDVASMISGTNQLTITATDALANSVVETVDIFYNAGSTWPLPYHVVWSNVEKVQDAVQIIDGRWLVTEDGIRPAGIEYDQVVALGDLSWTDFEVNVPITIHSFKPTPRDGAGFGLLLRWNEHTDIPIVCPQPKCGWEPNGGTGWYNLHTNGPLLLNEEADTAVKMEIGDSFTWKMKVVTLTADTARYSLKVWPSHGAEPSTWNITKTIEGNRQSGSLALVAHNSDVSLGNVVINPVENEKSNEELFSERD